MENYRLEIIETLAILLVLFLVRFITRRWVNRTLKKLHLSFLRRRITIKVINFFLIIGAIISLTAIWGIDRDRLLLFISSVLTILGIAFFAQWSILSNITAGLILFFNHPLRLGDHIQVLEKDFIIEGKIDDITFFFLHIKTEKGEKITIPNSIVLQKNISVTQEPERKEST
ncbi:MAG TPA: mechanosensitive ion channel family protein [Prolixibacteraceae bacterium]|nr:mechanosensitive ion channel family protein [Prolixibacteraceae bacterium]